MRMLVACLALALDAAVAPAQTLTCAPFNSNGIYELGEKAGWTVTLPQDATAAAGTYTYIIKKNNLDLAQKGTLEFSSGRATIETALNEPAILYVEVLGKGSPTRLGAAIAPRKLQPSVPRPADFDSFWDGKLKALAQIPIDPVVTRTPTDKPGVELYTVKLNSLGSHVQGFLAKPAKEGKLPALIIYQWAGVYALRPEWATERAAEGWLVFDVDSHDLPPSEATGVSPNYQAIGDTSRDTSYFLNMYLRDVRAIDYISSRPDWNGKTIAVTGTSMGGQQSLAAAGLSPMITAVIVNEPAGADSNGDLHGRKAGYPNWPSDSPAIMQTALYFDTVNFASRIKAPVLAAMGFIDTAAPPAGIWIALNQIPGPKEAIPMVESDHNNITPEKQGAWNSRSREVLDLILHGGEFKPRQ
ncbi:MAG TPA: acetylxylan esterase [Bryobacteraceae bacterium]|nr:acetylxylan esterase [Bryobacteraceae bacterium]